MSFSSGDQVYAKWPGSHLYYQAQISRGSGDSYWVEFKDGSKERIPTKYIRSEKRMRSKSPARQSRSRSRSRGRSKSPARSKAKAKSSPSPSRKSPSRSSRSSGSKTPKTPSTPTRVSARIASQESQKEEKKENASSLQQRKETPRKKDPAKGQSELLSQLKNFLTGPVLILGLIALLPIFLIAFNVGCGKTKCTIQEAPRIPTDYTKYFNLEVAGVFAAYVAVQTILSLLPVGRIVSIPTSKGSRKPKYRVNGFFSTVVTLTAFGVMYYLKFPVTYLYNHFLQFLGTSIAFGTILSILLYIKGRKTPASEQYDAGNTGNIINDFFFGREVNPRIGTFNFKLFIFSRVFSLGWLLLNLSMLAHDYKQTGEFNIPATMVAAFQGLYILTFAFYEEALFLNSREVYEGFGYYYAVLGFAGPFIYSFNVRFLIQHPQVWNNYSLAGIGFLSIVGYIMMYGSLLQKYQFRKNPHDPALAHLDRIPTANGKGLLVGGWWSICRKPNYLGDLLQFVAWSLMCGFEYAMPYILPLLLLVMLLDRQRQDERECRVKHGAAWDRYCQRVKSRLVPKLF